MVSWDSESDEIKEATGTSENIAAYNSREYITMVFPTLETFFIEQRREEVVVKDVASILKDAGFVLKDNDVCLSNTDSESDEIKESMGSSESIPAYEPEMCPNELPLDYSFPYARPTPLRRPVTPVNTYYGPSFNLLAGCQLTPLRRPVTPVNTYGYRSSFILLAPYRGRKFSSCPFFMRQKNQFKGEKNAMWRRIQPSISSNVFASLAMAFKRGLRRV